MSESPSDGHFPFKLPEGLQSLRFPVAQPQTPCRGSLAPEEPLGHLS